MVFSSTVFLFIFLPVVYLLYLAVRNLKARNIILIIASLFFYAYGEPIAVILMILSVVMNYIFGLGVVGRHKKLVLTVSVIFNVSMLFVFKYLCFTLGLLSYVFPFRVPIPDIALPIGISFFTFQAMSYVIDVYKKPSLKEKNILNIFLYISLFPQLIAGPIIRYEELADELKKRSLTLDKTVEGIRRFLFGLAKKMLIANTMGQIADSAFNSELQNISSGALWIGAAAYMLQIYYDFSGYSDMALGLGKMFGFTFPENFNYPFVTLSMQDFWHRWNISVSTWFRQYVYFPLGGNRKGKRRTNINRLVVFFLTGLWHGANLTFIVWGLIHGLFLLLENSGVIGFVKSKNPLLKIVSHIYCLIVILFTFVIFRADSLTHAWSYISRMFTGFETLPDSSLVYGQLFNPYGIIVTVFAVIFCMPVAEALKKLFARVNRQGLCEALSCTASLGLYAMCILSLMSASYNPFIYFRF